jgi:predicted hotdog family 3-hydroxylacyl-ACP dehydratase
MAQAVAAHAGLVARLRGKPIEIGFWLGTRRADFFTDAYWPGQTLHVAARHVWGEGELFSFDCSIVDGKNRRSLASAQLNVFRPADAKKFFKEERP